MSRKKKKGKKKDAESNAQEEGLPDFLKLFPSKEQEGSKVVFRMKKKREIPSCKDIFADQSKEGGAGKRKSGDRSFARVGETEERLSRTLFVGNLPVNTTKKVLHSPSHFQMRTITFSAYFSIKIDSHFNRTVYL